MADIPGNARTQAVLPRGSEFTPGEFEREGDRDWYQVSLRKGVNYAFSGDILEYVQQGPDDYAYLTFRLRDPSGKVVKQGGFADTYDDYDFGFEYRPTKSGVYFVEAVAGFFTNTINTQSTYGLRVRADAAPDLLTTAEVEIGEIRNVSFFYGGDIDTYRVELVAGERYDFDAAGILSVLNRNGRVLASSELGTIEDFRAPRSGLFFLRAEDDSGNMHFDYTISVLESDGSAQSGTVLGLGGDDDFVALGDAGIGAGGGGDGTVAARGGRPAGLGGERLDAVADVGADAAQGSGLGAGGSGADPGHDLHVADRPRGDVALSAGSFVL